MDYPYCRASRGFTSLPADCVLPETLAFHFRSDSEMFTLPDPGQVGAVSFLHNFTVFIFTKILRNALNCPVKMDKDGRLLLKTKCHLYLINMVLYNDSVWELNMFLLTGRFKVGMYQQ